MKRLPPWHRMSHARLELERSILTGLDYFRFERESLGQDESLTVIGTLAYRREMSGRKEEFRVRLEYPDDFPRDFQRIFDHDERFTPGSDGHLLASYQLCLTLPERREFALSSQALTEEVLGASLVWLDKRLIYERMEKWPGAEERHGAWGKLDFILEQARLKDNAVALQWAEQLLTSAVSNGRTAQVDVYSLCPCGSGRSLKFCHYEGLRPLVKLIRALSRSALGLGEK